MKVLIVSYSDTHGGAAKAAHRLHQSLLGSNVDSQMLVLGKKTKDYTILAPETNLEKLAAYFKPRLEQLFINRKYKNKSPALFSSAIVSSKNFVKKINSIKPDIVHLHWVTGAMLKIEDVAKIKAPIVWSLHDMWAFTGGCHYTDGCLNYLEGCGNCPSLNSNRKNDLSRKVLIRKEKTFDSKEDILIVGTSKWLEECSKSSSLMSKKSHINLPNPINTKIFKPFDKYMARELWNLPQDKKLILFGSMGTKSDLRKGFNELSEALQLVEKGNIELVIFGESKPLNPPNFNFKTHYLGILNDDTSLATLYNAVDVTLTPSKQENLSNVIMENLSCGTPVVAFNIGGNADTIEHKKNGYLAKPYDTTDLKNGIEWVLNNENYDELCKNARAKVVREFDSKIVAKKYIELYKKVLNEKQNI